MSQGDAWPYTDWLREGVKVGLAPAEIWAMSICDLRTLTRADQTAMAAFTFEALCRAYPDGDVDG